MSDTVLSSAFGDYKLQPLHHHPRSPLRAWNAADELMLQHLTELEIGPHQRVLVVNDSNGALAVSLHRCHPHSWNDHATSRLALQQNLARNQLNLETVLFIPAHEALDGNYDVVLLQLPKTLSLLEYQLTQLRRHILPTTQIIAGGMVKHMSARMTAIFERCIGPTHTSLAQKKARLVFSTLDANPQPRPQAPLYYSIPHSPLQLVNHANVFSQQKLDIGTRFLLENFPDLSGAKQILDLGCGNGALGIYAGWKQPQATLHFVDDSYLAVQSARDSYAINKLPNPAFFYNDDCLAHFSGQVDTILCNPPFHEGNKVHTDIAARMFRDAARHLTSDGSLYIVANRHLEYRPLLAKLFGRHSLLASNPKFVVIRAEQASQASAHR